MGTVGPVLSEHMVMVCIDALLVSVAPLIVEFPLPHLRLHQSVFVLVNCRAVILAA